METKQSGEDKENMQEAATRGGRVCSKALREMFFPISKVEIPIVTELLVQDYSRQKRAMQEVVTKLKRLTYAEPFKTPVDPIALGIPDYFEKIKYPMDISKIEIQLKNDMYQSKSDPRMFMFEDFVCDFELTFNNCFLYNRPESEVFQCGEALRTSFTSYMGKALNSLAIPKEEAGGRPAEGGERHGGMTAKQVMDDLCHERHLEYTRPFLRPVDAILVPEYYNVITNPIDFQTILKHIETEKEKYTVDRLSDDLELLLKNCYHFNPPGSEVYECGKKLEGYLRSLLLNGRSASKIGDGERRRKKSQAGESGMEVRQKDGDVERRPSMDKRQAEIRELKQMIASAVKRLRALCAHTYTKEEMEALCMQINALGPKELEKITAVVECRFPEILSASADGDKEEVTLDINLLDNDTLDEIKKTLKEIEEAETTDSTD